MDFVCDVDEAFDLVEGYFVPGCLGLGGYLRFGVHRLQFVAGG